MNGQHISHIGTNSFAFITYDDTESALYAIKRMDGIKLGRYRVKGKRSAGIYLFDVKAFLLISMLLAVNRAKIPERNRVGFGNVPWKDEGEKNRPH